jgi:hypothetical protein
MKSVWLVESCGDDMYDRRVAVKTFKSVVAARKFCLERIEVELTEPEFGDVRPRESVFISVRRKFTSWEYDDMEIDREFFAYVPCQGSYIDSSGDPAEVEKLSVTSRWTVRKLEFVS